MECCVDFCMVVEHSYQNVALRFCIIPTQVTKRGEMNLAAMNCLLVTYSCVLFHQDNILLSPTVQTTGPSQLSLPLAHAGHVPGLS